MAYQANIRSFGNARAKTDLSAASNQFRAVKLDADGEIVLAGVGEASLGILQNKPAAGQAANVATGGQSKARAGGTIAAGADVAVGANGLLVAASGARVNTTDAASATDPVIGPNIIGQAVTAAVVNDIFTLNIAPRGAVPATVAA